MQFKFKHSKWVFNVKDKPASGVTAIFGSSEFIKKEYLALTKFDKNSIVDDLTVVGNVLSHGETLFISLGKLDKSVVDNLDKAVVSFAKFIAQKNISEINIILPDDLIKKSKLDYVQLVERVLVELGNSLYYFDDFKSTKEKGALAKINIITAKDVTAAIENAVALLEGLFIVRDLGNNPSNIATPGYLAKTAKSFEKINKNVSVEILTTEAIKKLGMNAFLGVAKGSKEEPHFIKLEYNGAGKKGAKPIVLVGKGITFDSGGISIKPSANMEEMKFDMCGAASVLGVFAAVAHLKLKVNLVVLVATCENMPSGIAQKPGDIVTTMSGKTVEVLNTDAEGRMILCDALHYAKGLKPEFVVDVATLTGACVVALGSVVSGLYVNDETLYADISAAAKTSNDKVWRMPLDPEYIKMLKSKYADLANISWGGKAGSVTAACFLQEFVDYKWAHLDVAGTAYSSESGATGRPFKLLTQLIRDKAYQG